MLCCGTWWVLIPWFTVRTGEGLTLRPPKLQRRGAVDPDAPRILHFHAVLFADRALLGYPYTPSLFGLLAAGLRGG